MSDAALAPPGSVFHLYASTRAQTERICDPLEVEDFVIQSMEDSSPPKWHLAHTTWFFETFVLEPFLPGYKIFDPSFKVLFNSYYESVGKQHPRSERGLLSRPSTDAILNYRRHVDRAIVELWATDLASCSNGNDRKELERRLTLGIHHEQQHQELALMDIKHNFFKNPLRPIYHPEEPILGKTRAEPLTFQATKGATFQIGAKGSGIASEDTFAYDNEFPRHEVTIGAFEIANRLVTCGEWREFIESDGYSRPEYWLSDGFAAVKQREWTAPLYWERDGQGGDWNVFTMAGMRAVKDDEPVCHVSFYEADAYARFRKVRLPRESEWERIASSSRVAGGAGEFLESQRFHPLGTPVKPGDDTNTPNGKNPEAAAEQTIRQIFGSVWEHTQSPYTAYPGYRCPEGALGEYNGKFMCNQMVSRGGSVFTPESHIRPSYRNFFYPHQRWACHGVRLARDLES